MFLSVHKFEWCWRSVGGSGCTSCGRHSRVCEGHLLPTHPPTYPPTHIHSQLHNLKNPTSNLLSAHTRSQPELTISNSISNLLPRHSTRTSLKATVCCQLFFQNDSQTPSTHTLNISPSINISFSTSVHQSLPPINPTLSRKVKSGQEKVKKDIF